MKWLDIAIIYHISNSSQVSPIQFVPKKESMIVVKNNKNELIPTRTITCWRICTSYRKLNKATGKDHFPLLFIVQCQINWQGMSTITSSMAILDIIKQHKTTFTCPYCTFSFRRMQFGLCNGPSTFQRSIMSIFSNMVKRMIEVFIDDFFVVGNSFNTFLDNLMLVL